MYMSLRLKYMSYKENFFDVRNSENMFFWNLKQIENVLWNIKQMFHVVKQVIIHENTFYANQFF